jgi:hypothetical protein
MITSDVMAIITILIHWSWFACATAFRFRIQEMSENL